MGARSDSMKGGPARCRQIFMSKWSLFSCRPAPCLNSRHGEGGVGGKKKRGKKTPKTKQPPTCLGILTPAVLAPVISGCFPRAHEVTQSLRFMS